VSVDSNPARVQIDKLAVNSQHADQSKTRKTPQGKRETKLKRWELKAVDVDREANAVKLRRRACARKVQRAWRTHCKVQKECALREQVKLAEQVSNWKSQRSSAAAKIQRAWRHRRLVRQLTRCASELVRQRRRCQMQAVRVRGATHIQAWWRAVQARERCKVVKAEVMARRRRFEADALRERGSAALQAVSHGTSSRRALPVPEAQQCLRSSSAPQAHTLAVPESQPCERSSSAALADELLSTPAPLQRKTSKRRRGGQDSFRNSPAKNESSLEDATLKAVPSLPRAGSPALSCHKPLHAELDSLAELARDFGGASGVMSSMVSTSSSQGPSGFERPGMSLDRPSTCLDRPSTGLDRSSTGLDRSSTGLGSSLTSFRSAATPLLQVGGQLASKSSLQSRSTPDLLRPSTSMGTLTPVSCRPLVYES